MPRTTEEQIKACAIAMMDGLKEDMAAGIMIGALQHLFSYTLIHTVLDKDLEQVRLEVNKFKSSVLNELSAKGWE